MIQPISTLTPRVGFRGAYQKGSATNKIAVANALGIATAAGGLTTLVARAYTNSFAHAGILGVFGAILTGFFMTPHLIEKIGLGKKPQKVAAENILKSDTPKVITAVKEHAGALRRVPFRSA